MRKNSTLNRLSYAALAILGADGLTMPAMAEDTTSVEYPSAVATFDRICLVPGVNPADRLTALEATSGWTEDSFVSVDIPQMAVSRAIDRNYSFSNVESAKQWSGEIDGHNARFVLASFGGKTRYKNLCALVFDGPRNAMPYADELKADFKTFGIGGKSVDLVHYFEFAGKLGPDNHPVRGEIFLRSLSRKTKQTTHIYVAY